IYAMIERSLLPCVVRIGRRLLIRQYALLDWLRQKSTPSLEKYTAMSVRVRSYRKSGWMVDVNTRLPNGSRYRERRRLRITSKSAAQRWGEERERHLLQHGPAQPKKEVTTLQEIASRFLDGYARANRQKPSGIAAKESIMNGH